MAIVMLEQWLGVGKRDRCQLLVCESSILEGPVDQRGLHAVGDLEISAADLESVRTYQPDTEDEKDGLGLHISTKKGHSHWYAMDSKPIALDFPPSSNAAAIQHWVKMVNERFKLQRKKRPLLVLHDNGGVMQVKNAEYERMGEDGSKLENKDGEWMPGLMTALQTLEQREIDQGILSFCGKAREAAVREQLTRDRIVDIIPEDRWVFVRNRKHKAMKMTELKADVLIDDSADIVTQCRLAGHKVLHFGGPPGHPDSVADWAAVCTHPYLNRGPDL